MESMCTFRWTGEEEEEEEDVTECRGKGEMEVVVAGGSSVCRASLGIVLLPLTPLASA